MVKTEVVQMDMCTETKRREINNYFFFFLLLSEMLLHINVVRRMT